MKCANDLRCAADALRGPSIPCTHLENDTLSLEPADGASWESAWIDLGGEG